MENSSNRYKELETVDREHSERKVRRGKKRRNKMTVTSASLTTDDRDNKIRTRTTTRPLKPFINR